MHQTAGGRRRGRAPLHALPHLYGTTWNRRLGRNLMPRLPVARTRPGRFPEHPARHARVASPLRFQRWRSAESERWVVPRRSSPSRRSHGLSTALGGRRPPPVVRAGLGLRQAGGLSSSPTCTPTRWHRPTRHRHRGSLVPELSWSPARRSTPVCLRLSRMVVATVTKTHCRAVPSFMVPEGVCAAKTNLIEPKEES